MEGTMRIIAAGILLVASITTASPAAANVTGNDLKEYCDAPDQTPKRLYCDGYIAGALDAFRQVNAAGGTLFCEQPSVTGPQLIAIVQKRLADQPEALHYTASSIIFKVMHEDFPCPNSN
jgi:hypothetical protein